MNFIYVFIGGGTGALSRYLISNISNRFIVNFPAGTILSNITGTFLIGFFSIFLISKAQQYPPHIKELIMVGYLGGLTTFSSFILDCYNLFDKQKLFLLAVYLFLNLVIGVLLFLLGHKLAL